MKEMLSYFKGLDRRSATVLIATPFLITFYIYQGNHAFFSTHIAPSMGKMAYPQWMAYGYQFLMLNILFLLIPILLVKFVMKEKLTDYGLGLGDWRFGIKAILIALPLTLPLLYFSAADKAMQATYPLVKVVGQSPKLFILWAGTYLTFYIAWEFMFRGFMQFGLREKFGTFGSIMFQVMVSTIMHYDKPFPETFSAIIAGAIWGAIALRTRSIYYVLIFHWLFGLSNDLFVIMLSR